MALLQSRRFLEIDQSETLLPVAAMFVNDRDTMSNRYREPSIYASYQVSVHLAKQFQRSYWSVSKTAFPLKPFGQMI
jgi:hypothetical protein